MKKRILTIIILGFIWLIPIAIVSADYVALESLPKIGEVEPSTSLSGYLQWVFAFAISVAAIAAVASLVIAGVRYIVAYGNPSEISSAKDQIKNALLGLLLAICAWLILYTIGGENLIKGALNIPTIDLGELY